MYREGSTATYSRLIFLEMVDLCVCTYLQMNWIRLFRMKRLGAPTVGLGGVGNPACIVALNISAWAWDDIFRSFPLVNSISCSAQGLMFSF